MGNIFHSLREVETLCALDASCTGLSRDWASDKPNSVYHFHGPAEMDPSNENVMNFHWNARCFYKKCEPCNAHWITEGMCLSGNQNMLCPKYPRLSICEG